MELKRLGLKGTYKVKFYDEYFEAYDERDNLVYFKSSDGFWSTREYDERDNIIYYEDSSGMWSKSEYNERGNITYYENSDGFWSRRAYDEEDNTIYYEDSEGEFVDNRIKELTVREIEKLLGYKIKIKGE